ncbi:LysM peptidoglycan-binding domain-containing M23 family metallopeptidase [Aquibaculum arenosum]|uniref:LysM peptidoglycan-binding domain-containing M23 family metallopeptidase n=1 Tax=Aquibaculum arenosum TaxID=3032591 RepID=A0ABT5YN59_9PROT|nr:LysM peptidoglycan-binding domain-containing M23 family metallopeptidase [Fodinicurvata sp. CAU 1616]MDF2096379.1 LysM peptidoglycan-binding domain-containing M23 family metallopeptidase [Fodinicurvata sp. CAU 1616]
MALSLLGAALLTACSNPERIRNATLPQSSPQSQPASSGPILPEAATPDDRDVDVAPLSSEPLFSEPLSSEPSAPEPSSSEPPSSETAKAAATRVEPQESAHRVVAGDTLFSIAQRYDVPLAAMIDANNLTPPFDLRVGQRLAIPSVQVHEVRRGETLQAIAGQYETTPEQLAEANRLEPPYSLWTGQRLVLLGGAASESRGEVDVTLAEAAAATSPAGQDQTQTPAEEAPPEQSAVQDEQDAPPPEPAESSDTASPPAAAEEEEAAVASATATPEQVSAPPPRSGGRFLWPLEGEMIARYGPQGDGRHNDGINIAAERGTEVRAAENGVVAYAGNELRGFGNLLLIKHSDEWITAYAHNDRLLVSAGDTVSRGQVISQVGSSGSVGQPQLHFEIRKGTRAIDPLPLLDGAGG